MTSLAERIARNAERSVQPVKSYDVTNLTGVAFLYLLVGLSLIASLWFVDWLSDRFSAGMDVCSNPPGEYEFTDLSCQTFACLHMKSRTLDQHHSEVVRYVDHCQ